MTAAATLLVRQGEEGRERQRDKILTDGIYVF
jgi:hypothetical protein